MTITADQAAQLTELLDRVAIEDVLKRYCHGVDRCDTELLKTVYWPGAVDDHIFWKGIAEDFIAFCIPVLETRDQTLHAISNIMIRIEGDRAYVQCYFNAYERVKRKDGSANDLTMHGRYLDRFEKRGQEWRIADRKCVMDWWRVWDDTFDWERGVFGQSFTPGARREKDYAHTLFGDRLYNVPVA